MRRLVSTALLLLFCAAPGLCKDPAPDSNAGTERHLLEGMMRYRLDAAGEQADPLRPVLERMLEDDSRSQGARARDVLDALRQRLGMPSEVPHIPVAKQSPLAPAESLRREAIDGIYRSLRLGRVPNDCCACGAPFQVSNLWLDRDVAPGSADLTWDPAVGASVYNVYSGSLTNLSDLSCILPDLTTTSAVDSSIPAPLLLYLVSAESCDESGIGDATAGPRVPPQTCP